MRTVLTNRTHHGMLPSMNVERIRARLTGGFRPFVLVTSSGGKYPVPHPEFIFVTPKTVIIADAEGYTTLLEPFHITAIEDLPARKNGRTRRTRRSRKQ